MASKTRSRSGSSAEPRSPVISPDVSAIEAIAITLTSNGLESATTIGAITIWAAPEASPIFTTSGRLRQRVTRTETVMIPAR